MKRIILTLLAIVILFSMTACFGKKSGPMEALDNKHARSVTNDVKIFESGNISDITVCIFGENANVGDSTEGIIADLFSNADVEISDSDDASITYIITAPDISDFFTACADDLDAITTSEELAQAIQAYAEIAPQKEYIVSVPYTISDKDIDVSYDTPEFINAMTGGLLDAYFAVYDQYLSGEG